MSENKEQQIENIPGIYTRLAAIMREAKAIGKDTQNTQQGFKFRGIDAVMNHLHPLFAKHSVIVLPEIESERSEERQTRSGGNLIYRVLKIKYRFCCDNGEASCSVMAEGMDSGDKACAKCLAIGLKYALTQMLLLPYDEVDPDAETQPESKPKHPQPPQNHSAKSTDTSAGGISVAQRKRLFALAEEGGIGKDRLKEIMADEFGVDSTSKLTPKMYEEFCDYLKFHAKTEGADENKEGGE